MENVINALNDALGFTYDNILSILMMVLLIVAGLFLSVRTRFLQFRKFGYVLKNTIGSLFNKNLHKQDKGSVSPFQAVTTALAGTIGTGSIAGVATALVLGGPGAVFWMWISALLGMVTKYSEIVLAIKFREKNENGAYVGGPMYYIKNGLGKKWLAGDCCGHVLGDADGCSTESAGGRSTTPVCLPETAGIATSQSC